MEDKSSSVPSVFMKRRLDNALTASIDVVNLNNVIVKMRPKVHAAKLVVIQKLRERIGKLRKMKGSEQQKQLNSKKASEREKEIEVIKALGKDHISKYAIGSTSDLQAVCSKPGVLLEEVALVRLAGHQYIQKIVQEFRSKHPDWKELGAFLMTKQTNREFKKKKRKPDKLTLKMKQLKKKKAKVRVEASETMMKSYLYQKLKDEGIDTDSDLLEDTGNVPNMEINTHKHTSNKKPEENDSGEFSIDDDNNETEDDFMIDTGVSEKHEVKLGKKNKCSTKSKLADSGECSAVSGGANEAVTNHSISSDESDSEEGDSGPDSDNFTDLEGIELGSNSDTDAAASDHDSHSEHIHDSGYKDKMAAREKMPGTKKLKNSVAKDSKYCKNEDKDKNKKYEIRKDLETKSDTFSKKKTKLKSYEKVEGEVIVKKLNLDEWCNSDSTDTKIPDVILTDTRESSGQSVVKTNSTKLNKKVRDPFFDTGERLFQSRDSQEGELGKNLLAFAGYVDNGNGDHAAEHDNPTDVYHQDDYRNDNDYDEIFNEKSRRDGSVYRKANELGKEAFRTTFMGSLNGEDEYFGKKFFKRDRDGNDRFRDKHRGGNEVEYNKKKGVSAGTKAKFKKMGITQSRDSKQEELGSSLLAIAGYQTGGTGSDVVSEKKKESWEKKPSSFSMDHKKGTSKTQGKSSTIHPSWEASLKRKQQQTSTVEFTGKKIKFDDD